MQRVRKNLLLWSFLALTPVLSATTIGYIYPAGARAGDTIQVIVGGQGLWGNRRILLDSPGVTLLQCQGAPGTFYAGCGEQNAWAREYMRRVFAGEHRQPYRRGKHFGVWRYNHFMEQLDQLDPLMLSLACKGIFERPNSLQASPAIGQKLVLTLKIDKNAAPGVREFRILVGGKNNLRGTNPLLFYIGREPEFREQNYQMPPLKKQPVEFTIPGVVNGQIEPGEVDHFKFRLKKGESCHFALKGRKLNPFIGDGVPGNFQPVLAVKDAAGKVLAYADDNYFDPDPVLDFTAPADALYTLEIRDALYRGREDFVYRINVARGKYQRPALVPPALGIPEICEHAAAETVLELPKLVSGSVSKPGEVKVFKFKARKNQKIAAEVFARRLGSPLDSSLKIIAPDGKQLAFNDDFERPLIGLNMQHVDSFVSFKAPADGIYTVQLSDTASAGGADYGFFLRLDRPRPDFRVYMVPSGVWLSPDSAADPVKVVVEKLDGFNGEISFELKNAPNISIGGIKSIPKGASESQISFVTGWVKGEFLPVYPELWAVHGRTRRRVIGADAAMQAFAYTHYVPSRQLIFMRTWLHSCGDRFYFDKKFNYRINLRKGKSVSADLFYRVTHGHREPAAEITLPDAPKGVSMKAVKVRKDLYRLIFTADPKAENCNVNIPAKVKYTFKYRDNRRKEWRSSSTTFHLPMFRLTVR